MIISTVIYFIGLLPVVAALIYQQKGLAFYKKGDLRNAYDMMWKAVPAWMIAFALVFISRFLTIFGI